MLKWADERERRGYAHGMKFVNLYLVGYVVLLIAGVIALWKTGVLQRMSPIWIVVLVLVAIGVGLMMAVSSGKPTGPTIT